MFGKARKGYMKLQRTALSIFRGLASSYDKVLDIATLGQDRYWKRWVIESLGARVGELVLDVGCGTCLFEERVEGQGYQVVGLDLTERMLRVGQSKRLEGTKALILGDAESLPFSDDVFDAVVSCYVPKYVALGRLTEEIGRVLRPNGRVVLYDFIRPRGLIAPVLRLYIHGGLRGAGHLLGLAGNETAKTFRDLPGIVEGAIWDQRIERAFNDVGVWTLSHRTLSGGVIGAYSGRKR